MGIKNRRGLSMIELAIGVSLLAVVLLGLSAAILSFSKGQVSFVQTAKLHYVMNLLKNSLYSQTRGSAWYSMNSSGVVTHSPNLFYEYTVGPIINSARQIHIRVFRYEQDGSVREITDDMVLSPRQGINQGGVIRVKVITDETTPQPVQFAKVSVNPFAGTIPSVGVTGPGGEYLLTQTQLGPAVVVTVNLDTENQPPYYFKPASVGLKGSLSKSYTVAVNSGIETQVTAIVTPKLQLTVKVVEKNEGVDTATLVTKAWIYFEGWNMDIPGSYSYRHEVHGGQYVYRIPPGSFRVTVLQADSPGGPRMGVDGIDSAYNTNQNSFTLAAGAAPSIKTIGVSRRGSVQGEAHRIDYSGGLYGDSGISVPGMKIWFTANGYLTAYGGTVFDFTWSRINNNYWGWGYPQPSPTTNSSGQFLAAAVAPLVTHFNEVTYPATDAWSSVIAEPHNYTTSALLPVRVAAKTGVTPPADRTGVEFWMVGQNWEKRVYPVPPDSANSRTNFLFPVKTGDSANSAANSGRHLYFLNSNTAHLLRARVRLNNPSAFPLNTGRSDLSFWVQSAPSTSINAWRVESSGGSNSLNPNYRIRTDPASASHLYDAGYFVPLLGTNQFYAHYTNWAITGLAKNFKITPRVYYKYYNPGTTSYLVDYRVNNTDDDFNVIGNIDYWDPAGGWQTIASETFAVVDGDFAVVSQSAKSVTGYKGTSALIPGDPGDPGELPITVVLEGAPQVLTHRIYITNTPTNRWPIYRELWFNAPTPDFETLSYFYYVSHPKIFGRVCDTQGNPVVGGKIEVQINAGWTTNVMTVADAGTPPSPLGACGRLPCTNEPQYMATLDVPHSADPANWKLIFTHPDFVAHNSPGFSVSINNDHLGRNQEVDGVQYDFYVVRKAGSGM